MIACISRLLLLGFLLSQLTACGSMGGGSSTGGSSSGGASKKASNNPEFISAVGSVQAQNWALAESKLLALREQYPEAAGVMTNLGIVYLNQGRNKDAEQVFTEAIAANPNVDTYNLLGVSLRQQGRFTEALAAYREALVLDASHADTNRNIGILYDVYLDDPLKARKHYLAYQSALSEPDEQVAGWVMAIEQSSGIISSAPAPSDDAAAEVQDVQEQNEQEQDE